MTTLRIRVGLAAAAVALALSPTGLAQRPNPDAAALERFNARIAAFVQIRQKAGADAPPLPDDSSPEQIDAHQRAVATQVQTARAPATQGDVADAAVREFLRRIVSRQVQGPDGAEVRASILDEDPGDIVVGVNERYPDTVPLATMPPQLLRELPKLPRGLEYRFVGRTLVIVDATTNLIVEIVPDALPE